MNLADTAEQRKHPRVEVKWSVMMETPEGKLVGKTENISCGGAYIRCSKVLSKNDFFHYDYPGSKPRAITRRRGGNVDRYPINSRQGTGTYWYRRPIHSYLC